MPASINIAKSRVVLSKDIWVVISTVIVGTAFYFTPFITELLGLPQNMSPMVTSFFHLLSQGVFSATVVFLLIESTLKTREYEALQGFLPDALTEAVRRTAGGHMARKIRGAQLIYEVIAENLGRYPYFYNTILSNDDSIFPIDIYRKRYYDCKLKLILKEKIKCKEVFSGAAKQIYQNQTNYLKCKAPKRVSDLKARLDAREIQTPNMSSVISFCVFLETESFPRDGVVMFGWMIDETNVADEQECIISDHPDIVEYFVRHFTALHGSGRRFDWVDKNGGLL